MQSSNLRQGDNGDDVKTLETGTREQGLSPGAMNASLIPNPLGD